MALVRIINQSFLWSQKAWRFAFNVRLSQTNASTTSLAEAEQLEKSADADTESHGVVKHYTPLPKQVWVKSLESGDKLALMELDHFVFGTRPRVDILHRVVVWQRARMRAGTAKVKDRSEVSGGGRKPWRQKGSGQARQGSRRAPHWRGGGRVHGPRGPVSYDYSLPSNVRSLGLRAALSIKYAQGDLHIVDSLELSSSKTTHLLSILDKHKWQSVLFVDGGDVDVNMCKASSNVTKVDALPSRGLNVYSILLRDSLVLSVGAVRMLEERLKEKAADT